VLNNAGETFRKIKNYDSALMYFNEAKSIFDQLNYLTGSAYCLGNIGMVYASIDDNDAAEKNMNEAIRILEAAQDYYPICDFLISMADVYSNRGDDQTALNYAVKSLRLAEQHGLKEQISNANLKLSELYERSASIGQAFKYYKRHIAYRDSLNNIKSVQEMANLRTDYEVSQKQKEVNMLKNDKRNQQIIVIALFVILCLTIMLLGSLYWFYRSRSKEKLRLHQQELLKTKLEIQEQTYLHISQELHDNIGQVLSLVKMNINTVAQTTSSVAKEKLSESADLLTKAIQDLRDMSKTLNADFLNEIGLPNAIDQQLQVLKRTGLYCTELSVQGDVDHYHPEQKLLVFRVVQELLNNIVKHANADKIVVSIDDETEKLVIRVQDNGRGFNTELQRSYPNQGLGLRNMHNRLKLAKGYISFQSEPGKGTTATIKVIK
jgi:signal transduction histidine kinase